MNTHTLKVLSAMYRPILKKCFIINAIALVAVSTANAQELKETILENTNISLQTTMNDGVNTMNGEKETHSPFIMNGGTLNMDNHSEIWSSNKGVSVKITGGKINIKGDSWINANDKLAISGGVIDLFNGGLASDSSDADSVSISDGTINFLGVSGIGSNNGQSDDSNNEETFGSIRISGGTINVSGGHDKNSTLKYINAQSVGNTNLITGSDINISGGEINIEKNAHLLVVKSQKFENSNSDDEDANIIDLTKSTLKYSNIAKLNVSGNLWANVEGNATININDSSAKIDGNVNGGNLNYNANSSLSSSISGNIKADSLNVNKSKLVYDKNAEFSNIKVNEGSVLDILDNTVKTKDIAFASGSELNFTITSKDKYGNIVADSINIDNENTKINLTLNGSALNRDETAKFSVLNSNNLSGTFAKLSENSRYIFEDNKDGTFTITGKATAGDIVKDLGGNENNVQVAEAWDNISTSSLDNEIANDIINKMAELSNSTDEAQQQKYINALTTLAPETAPVVQSSQTQISNQIFNVVGTRLSGSNNFNTYRGISSGDSLYNPSVWVQGLLNKAKYSKSTETEFDSDTWGTAVGLEKRFNRAFKAGIGYAYSKTSVDGFNRDTDVNTHSAIVYGEIKPNNWFANVIASYGWSDYEENKDVAGIGVKADYDVETIGLQATTGYDIYSRATGVMVTPTLGVRYYNIKNKEYTDTAGQKIKNDDVDVLTGVLGLNFSKQYRIIHTNIRVKPEAGVAFVYDINRKDTESTVVLPNNSAYTVSGDALQRYGAEVNAGLTTEFNDAFEISLKYEGKFREDYQDHSGLINAKVNF